MTEVVRTHCRTDLPQVAPHCPKEKRRRKRNELIKAAINVRVIRFFISASLPLPTEAGHRNAAGFFKVCCGLNSTSCRANPRHPSRWSRDVHRRTSGRCYNIDLGDGDPASDVRERLKLIISMGEIPEIPCMATERKYV